MPRLQDISLTAVHAWMRAAVTGDGSAEPLYAWLRDHLGWPDGGAEARARSAKGIRPRVSRRLDAVGGAADAPAGDLAAASSSPTSSRWIHDDIEDGDRARRGRPVRSGRRSAKRRRSTRATPSSASPAAC
ncbi:MAG: hypothetical protein U0470_08830 [Anaerolineae bacterium]